jgi:hypothetical protein
VALYLLNHRSLSISPLNSFVNFAAATFFCTYEIMKSSAASWLPNVSTPYVHMVAASVGELVTFCNIL